MISMVLATDMSSHFGDLAKAKARVSSSELDLKDKDKFSSMDSLMHAADISNPLKPFPVYFQWTERILTEYWNQVIPLKIIKITFNIFNMLLKGDKERENELPISYLMDRYTVNTAKSQIGFIDVIVKPLYEVVKCFLPDLQNYIANLDNNKLIWQGRIEEYDAKLSYY